MPRERGDQVSTCVNGSFCSSGNYLMHHKCTRGGSICNENPMITPSINALGFYAICQTKAQSMAVVMVYKTLFHLSKFNKVQTF